MDWLIVIFIIIIIVIIRIVNDNSEGFIATVNVPYNKHEALTSIASGVSPSSDIAQVGSRVSPAAASIMMTSDDLQD